MRCLPVTAFVIVAVLMHADVQGQESSAPPPEMKPLERLFGTWDVEQTTKVPEESRSTSTLKWEPILRGRYVQHMQATNAKEKPTQMGIATYDSNKKDYRYWFFMSSGHFTEYTGTWDARSQTFTFTNRLPGGGKGTIKLQFADETTYVWSLTTKNAGGEIGYQTEGKAVRQK